MSREFAGTLDQRVTLERLSEARDDLGAAGADWGLVASLWARVEPVAPAPWGEGDRPAARPRWRATVRRGVAVRVGDRMGWRGLFLSVRSVAADPATPDRLILQLEQMP